MSDDYDNMDELEVDILIEMTGWPKTPTLQELQGYKGTFEERKAALIEILRLQDAYVGENAASEEAVNYNTPPL